MKIPFALVLFCTSLAFLAGYHQVHAQSRDTAKYAKLQMLYPHTEYDQLNSFQVDTTIKKRFWRASGELLLVELIPWAYNYFIRDADFAHVTFSSIWYNLHFKNWEWDDNAFTTNQFAHPYHGSLYFNSFRTNGYNFWQSAPAAFAGSFIWEVAGETHPAAPNDFINTSLGGISLGEMTYRISNRIINKKQRGVKRQLSEIAATLINPVGGFNRILDGKWGKVTETVTDLDTVSLNGELDLGVIQIDEKNGTLESKGKVGWYARLRLLYGDPFVESKKAFSNFQLTVELGDDDSTKLNVVRVSGLLTSWELKANEHANQLLSLNLDYDFYHNSSFEYGAQSVSFNFLSEFFTSTNVKVITRAGVGAVILAAVPDAYLYYGEGRNYDYGPGFSLIGNAGILIKQRLAATLNYRGGWFVTINGNNSTHFLHNLSTEVRANLVGNLSLGVEVGYLILEGNYRDYPDITEKYPFARLSLGIKI
jgi:hypothetical protein